MRKSIIALLVGLLITVPFLWLMYTCDVPAFVAGMALGALWFGIAHWGRFDGRGDVTLPLPRCPQQDYKALETRVADLESRVGAIEVPKS